MRFLFELRHSLMRNFVDDPKPQRAKPLTHRLVVTVHGEKCVVTLDTDKADMEQDLSSAALDQAKGPGTRSLVVPLRLEFRSSFPSKNQTNKASAALLVRALDASVIPEPWKPDLDDSKSRLDLSSALDEALNAIADDAKLPIDVVAASLVHKQWLFENASACEAQEREIEALAKDEVIRAEKERRILEEAERILLTLGPQSIDRTRINDRVLITFSFSSAAHDLIADIPSAKRNKKSGEWDVPEKHLKRLDIALQRVQQILKKEYAMRRAEFLICPPPQMRRVRVSVSEDRVVFDFPYNADALAIVSRRLKGKPGWARYDRNSSKWSVPWSARELLYTTLPEIDAAIRGHVLSRSGTEWLADTDAI